MNLTPLGVAILVAIGLAAGLDSFCKWLQRFEVRNSPVLTGQVVNRKECRVWGVPSVEFTIQIEGKSEMVHAVTGKYLVSKVPVTVRFHYTDDPSKVVFLFEYERNPLWMFIFSWAVTGLFGVLLVVDILRRKDHDKDGPPQLISAGVEPRDPTVASGMQKVVGARFIVGVIKVSLPKICSSECVGFPQEANNE